MYAALLNNKLVLARTEEARIQSNLIALNQEKYLCPRCKKKVILVLSEKRLPFFKHQMAQVGRQGEKEEHYRGKINLKTALIAAGFPAKEEVPLAKGELRADILVNSQLAFEIQCAPLSKGEFSHRHNLYKKVGIIDIGIVGKRHYLTNYLNQRQAIFLRFNRSWGYYYLEIDSKREYLTLKYQILQEPLTRKIRYQIKQFRIDEVGILKLWQFNPGFSQYHLNKDSQKNYLLRQIQMQTKLGIKIAEQLYLNKLTLNDLPDYLFNSWRNPGTMTSVEKYITKIATHV
ncbi:competence protein [Lactobacillus mulieris]|uniref:competence protein CoiA n=1 Tax=Lactobacillus mulieris TaxID=2508708 RepID=UPI0022CE20D3|nr:competence protein CoiA family protein [Lactobacillus mulieris]MCZ9600497.1 competence protein [Lactobacillus mulieris]